MYRLISTLHIEDEFGRIQSLGGLVYDKDSALSPAISSVCLREWDSNEGINFVKGFSRFFGRAQDFISSLFHILNPEVPQVKHLPHNDIFNRKKTTAIPDPEWVVNEAGELGVRIGERVFFMYKGDPLEYETDPPGQGLYRKVEKREFGESGPISEMKKRNPKDWLAETGGWMPLPLKNKKEA